MKRVGVVGAAVMALLMLGATALLMLVAPLPASNAADAGKAQQIDDVDQIESLSRAFIATISSRDIQAMDKIWADKPYATFIGPLSTTIVVGWEGVQKAWEMRFSQFDRVTISAPELHIHTNGNVAWAVGIEKVQLLRKNGETLSFDAFVTNVFEKEGGRWLMVSHQATPIFKEAK
jgi:ketosteroid isomerase-like protein